MHMGSSREDKTTNYMTKFPKKLQKKIQKDFVKNVIHLGNLKCLSLKVSI